MATQTFDISGSDATSTAVTLGAGESLRVRFTTFTGPATARLKIVANSVTSYVTIDDKQAWATSGVIEADECSLEVKVNGPSSQVAGIIETFA